MKRSFLPLAVFAAVLAMPLSARTWTDARTGRTIEGDFISASSGKVKVKRSDTGQIVEIPLARLTVADREFVTTLPAPEKESDWPTWRGSDRRGHSPDRGLLKEWPDKGPPRVWTFENAGKGYSSPAIVDGKLYLTGTRDGEAELICLDASDGKELWSAKLGNDPEKGYNTGWGSGPRGTPTVSDGMVYALTANGDLTAVTTDGEKKWSKSFTKDYQGKVPSWGYSESPLVDGDKLIATPGGEGGAIVALDKKTGKEIWRSEGLEDGAQYSSLIIAELDGKKQYVQLFMKTLAGVDAETGKVLWKSDWPGRTAVIPTPIYQDGKVYVTAGYGVGCKLVDITGGEAREVWDNKVMKNHHGGVVLVDGSLYGFSDAGGLVCQNWETGELVWNKKGQGIQKGAVHYADGMLYCIDEREGSVFLVEASPKGYQEHGRFPMPKTTKLREGTRGMVWTHPLVLNGRLYLRDQDLVFCFEVKK